MSDESRLTHLDSAGRARMVDVSGKAVSERRAQARARLRMSPQTAAAIVAGNVSKGEVLGTARLAGILAAKQTATLIPLAHPIALSFVDLQASVDVEAGLVEIVSEVAVAAQTGVEMEALVACSVAALTVYDMVKGLEPGVAIEQVMLLEKTGGRSDRRADAGG
jgi:cyclic pyranopterin phosphate synthase